MKQRWLALVGSMSLAFALLHARAHDRQARFGAVVVIDPAELDQGFRARTQIKDNQTKQSIDLPPAHFDRGSDAESSWCAPDRGICIHARYSSDESGQWVTCDWTISRGEEDLFDSSVRVGLPSGGQR